MYAVCAVFAASLLLLAIFVARGHSALLSCAGRAAVGFAGQQRRVLRAILQRAEGGHSLPSISSLI